MLPKLLISLVLLSLCISFCESKGAFAWTFSGDLVKGEVSPPHNMSIGEVLGTASFGINSTHPVTVCVRRLIAPETNTSHWSRTCTYLYTSPVSSSLVLPPALYFVSVKALTQENTSFTGALSATICDAGSYGPNCEITPIVLNLESQSTLHLDTQVTSFLFDLKNDTLYQNVTFRPTLKRRAVKVVGQIRKDFLPNEGDTAGQQEDVRFSPSLNSSWVLESPAQGDWVMSLSLLSMNAQATTEVNLTIDVSTCPKGKAGPGCTDVTVLDPTVPGATVETTSEEGVFKYFSYNLTKENEIFGFSFFVQLNRDVGHAPALYLRKGQVPTENFYDVLIETPSSVDKNYSSVNYFESSVASHGMWYIGVKGTGKTFGLWFNAHCPKNCSDFGTCLLQENQYVCACNNLYERYDCSYREDLKGFRKPYLVITIIGAAIMGVAIFGIICLFTTRNKHSAGGYEILPSS